MEEKNQETSSRYIKRKLTGSAILVVVLCAALSVVSFALGVYLSMQVNGNQFTTGSLDISVSQTSSIDVVEAIAPGMTVEKEFTVSNNSSIDVYYEVYFEDVDGRLQDVLEVTVTEKDGDDDRSNDKVIYQGPVKDFDKDAGVYGKTSVISAGQSQELLLTFSFPELADNEFEEKDFTYKLATRATQVKNNPDRKFD